MVPIRVLVSDGHALSMQGVRTALSRAAEVTIAGEASDGMAAWNLVRSTSADVALLDAHLPGIDGLEIAGRIGRMAEPIPFLVLSMWPDEAVYNEAMLLGASGYLDKGSIAEELVAAVRAVAGGGCYTSTSAREFAARRRERRQELLTVEPGLQVMTPEESRVLALLARNMTTRGIAEEMDTSIDATEAHRIRLGAKLGLRGGHELLRFALEHRWSL